MTAVRPENRPATKLELDAAMQTLRIEMQEGFARIDLNGTTEILKDFGKFLQARPDFLIRAKEYEESVEDWEAVKRFLGKRFAIFKSPFNWIRGLLLLILTGVTFALGSKLVDIRIPEFISHWLGK